MNNSVNSAVSTTGNLEFLRTDTLADFKAKHGISSITIANNEDKPNSGYCFLFAGKMGAVSKSYNPSVGFKNPVVSEVVSSAGEKFLLLHEQGGGNLKVIQTL